MPQIHLATPVKSRFQVPQTRPKAPCWRAFVNLGADNEGARASEERRDAEYYNEPRTRPLAATAEKGSQPSTCRAFVAFEVHPLPDDLDGRGSPKSYGLNGFRRTRRTLTVRAVREGWTLESLLKR
jgi:hypothetical protein